MQAMNSPRRLRLGRWLLYGYVVLSAAALVWVTAVVRQQHIQLLAAREQQAQMVANVLLGATQNLEAVPGVLSAEGNPQIGIPLENAEGSIAQLEIAVLGYRKLVGPPLPHEVIVRQGRLLMLAREERARDGKLSPDTTERLKLLAGDLRALWAAYPVSLLARAQPAELAAVRVKLAQQLTDPDTRAWLQQNP